MKNKVIVKLSKIKNAGRGVFALMDIKKDEVVDVCPILIFNAADANALMETLLGSYVFEYGDGGAMLALGNGSLYNHSSKPNAKYELDGEDGKTELETELYITAIKPIKKGEEIFIDYGPEHHEKYKGK